MRRLWIVNAKINLELTHKSCCLLYLMAPFIASTQTGTPDDLQYKSAEGEIISRWIVCVAVGSVKWWTLSTHHQQLQNQIYYVSCHVFPFCVYAVFFRIIFFTFLFHSRKCYSVPLHTKWITYSLKLTMEFCVYVFPCQMSFSNRICWLLVCYTMRDCVWCCVLFPSFLKLWLVCVYTFFRLSFYSRE